MSNCCGSTPDPTQPTSQPWVDGECPTIPDIVTNPTICSDPVCAQYCDNRFAALPQSNKINLIGRIGKCLYQLFGRMRGFVVANGNGHEVTNQPVVKVPQLANYQPAPGGVALSPEGFPMELDPPQLPFLMGRNSDGVWFSYRGPTGQLRMMKWNGYNWELTAVADGKLQGPISQVDELILLGINSDQGNCDAIIDPVTMTPRAGFVIGDGSIHKTISCGTRRPALLADAELKVFSLMACTNRGPMGIPMPAAGIPYFCNGVLQPGEPPKYTAQDATDKKIPTGKAVGDYVEGAKLVTDGSGCFKWEYSTIGGATVFTAITMVAQKMAGLVLTSMSNETPPPGNTGTPSGSYNLATLNVPVGAKNVYIRARCAWVTGATASTTNAYVRVNGVLVCTAQGVASGYIGDSDSDTRLIPLNGSLTFTYEVQATVTGANSGAWAKLEVLGYDP
jgi:hypothetical protein